MIRNCKRCHRVLNVQNVEYCAICQNDIDKHSENNAWKKNNAKNN